MRARSIAPRACVHCGAYVLAGEGDFCCDGCEAVHRLLTEQGLERYYDLRGPTGTPVTSRREADTAWLAPLEAQIAEARGTTRLTLDVQGVHCSACLWLLDRVFRREPGALSMVINPALGRVEMTVDRTFPIGAFAAEVARFGYLLGPALKRARAPHRDLVVRLGVCAAIAMNTMLFAIAMYAGLDAGPIYRLFTALTFLLGLASVLVGGTVFFRSAWEGLRRGVLHLDLPIAVGIALAFAGSTYSYLALGGRAVYFDTLTVFIALMLAGRLLQERILEGNRRRLLESDGADGLRARRVGDAGASVVRAGEVEAGDRLLVAPGELFVVDAEVLSGEVLASLEWIRGESEPIRFAAGERVPAGATLLSRAAVTARAATAFSESAVRTLVQTPRDHADGVDGRAARSTPFWRTLGRVYATLVLVAATGGFLLWAVLFHDVARAVEVTTAVLVVTCPCAFGIATPLAHELALAGLRKAGLFVQSAAFLDRAPNVHRVVFDKTGTLTTGALEVADVEALRALAKEDRDALFDMASRSGHPRSVAVAHALAGHATFHASLDGAQEVEEHPGLGLSFGPYRFGDARWAAPAASATDGASAVSKGGELLALVRYVEALRPDAEREVRALTRAGYEVSILSGDAQRKVDALAREVGVPEDRALGDRDPAAKAAFVGAIDRGDVLFLGDGINDGPAAERASVSGTPAVDRPFLPARTDFYFVTPGLAPVGLALRVAKRVAAVTKRNLGIAVAYNLLAVGLAYAGVMSPLVCAVSMPLSSVAVVLGTTWSLSSRSPVWRSESWRS